MWAVLTNKHRFGAFFIGSGLSNVGTWCQNLAGILLIYRLTESTFMVGLVTVAQFGAPIVLAPWAGIVADRFDRRRILTVTQLGGAVLSAVLAVMTITGHITAFAALGIIAAIGLFQAFQSPAQLALIPLLVRPDHRELGLSLGSMQYNLARAVGPMIASGIIVFWDVGAAFAVNAASYFAYVIALQVLRPLPQGRPATMPRIREAVGAMTASPLIIPLMLVGLVISGATDAINTLGPALSVALTGSDESVGWFVTAFGLGAVVTGFVIMPWLQRFPRRLLWTLLVQGAGLAIFVLAPNVWIAIIGAAISGAGFLASSNRTLALVQGLVDPAILGRVTAFWLMAYLGGRALFAFVGGAVASAAGPYVSGTVVVGTIVVAAGGVWWIGVAAQRRARAIA